MDSPDNSGSPIAKHAQRLRERTDAICRFSGGLPTHEEGIAVFREYCTEEGMWLELDLDVFATPEDYGDEHEVWFADQIVIKLAYPNFFGLRVIFRPDEDKRCLPVEYFERWVLHNDLFGDDVNIIGAFDYPEGIRLVLIQKAIKGKPASNSEIKVFFEGNGWLPFETGDGSAWYDDVRQLVVSDTHRGNLIETSDGVLAPIDFRIQPVSGAMLDAVRLMVAKFDDAGGTSDKVARRYSPLPTVSADVGAVISL